MVALWLPLLLLGASFVINTGDWFQHKRHLQLQADAAALAGGDMFAACFNTGGGDAVIFEEATKYAGSSDVKFGFGGTPLLYTPLYNGQIGNAHKGPVSALYQSDRYTRDTSSRNDGTETQAPCETASLMFDVKMTESNLPWFFGAANTVFSPVSPNVFAINAHARVQLRALNSANPSLPLAVPDINPKKVGVTFVDEATGDELSGCTGPNVVTGTTCTFSMTKGAPAGGLNMWSGPATVTLPTAPAKIGVRVGIGGGIGTCAHINNAPSYTCFDGASTTAGLIRIRDYAVGSVPGPPTTQPPVLDGVWPASCSGNAFFFLTTGTCSSSVTAEVNYGTGPTAPNANYHVRAVVGGTTKELSPLSYDAGRSAWVWSTPPGSPFALPFGAGAEEITLSWEVNDTSVTIGGNPCTTKNSNPCKGTFAGAPHQRFYSGLDQNSASGPIRSLQLAGSSEPRGPASLVAGTHALSLTLGLAGNYSVHTPCAPPPSGGSYTCFGSDRAVLLRLKQVQGPSTFSIDCGVGNIRFQIENGCSEAYSINTPGICPDPAPPDPTDCVPVQPGSAVGPVRQGMNNRFQDPATGNCLPNNYPTVTAGDPRVIIAMITDFSAFNGGGGSEVPVISFGAFYVAGWEGARPSCDNEPFSNTGVAGTADDGYVWGHFIKYVAVGGVGGSGVCDPSGFLPCVPALTK